ncbi:diphthamide synthesis protein [Candidatus Woesearchaeota archaeon]|nr:diphthamide synthesis protein [Candidatus Woesearchaeota archaeon]
MYNLELEKAINRIKEENAKLVCIQLPDGLKPKSKEIAEELEKNTDAKIFIWMSSCFGACDTPNIDNFDLLIQFGHSRWKDA